MGLKHPSIAPYGAFTCADGRDIVLSIQNEREWGDFCRKVLLRPELLDDARCQGNANRVANRDFVDGVVAEVFSRASSGTMVDRLIDAQTAFANVNSVYDLVEHPQLRTRPMPVRGRTVQVPVSPWITPWDPETFPEAPELDAHGASIRVEFSDPA